MANTIFGNPKVALGFAGGIVAVALIASTALSGLAPGKPKAKAPPVAVMSTAPTPKPAASPAPKTFAQGQASGWGGAGSGWGDAPTPTQAPSSAAKPSFKGPSAADPFADLGATDDSETRVAGGRTPDRSSDGPTVTSSAAPYAPEVVPPSGESRGELEVSG